MIKILIQAWLIASVVLPLLKVVGVSMSIGWFGALLPGLLFLLVCLIGYFVEDNIK